MPGFLLMLAMAGHRAEPVYATFLNRFVDTMHAGPLYLTLLATIGIYGYSMVRRLHGAGMGLAVAVALLSFITPYSIDLDSVAYQRAWPLIAVGGVQVAIGCERRDARRVTLGAAFALAPCFWSELGMAYTLSQPGRLSSGHGGRAHDRCDLP